MDLQGVARCGREGIRVEGVGVGPEGVVASAVGVAIAEDDGAGAVKVEGGGAVHEDGIDGPAADIGDGLCRRSVDVHQTGHGAAVVGGHVGDDVGHHDVEGESPSGVNSSAIGVGVCERFGSFAPRYVTDDRWLARWLQSSAACIRDCRQRELISCGHCFAMDGINRIHLADGKRGRSVDENVLRDIGSVAAGIGDGIGAEDGEIAAVGDGVVRS